MTWTQTCGTSSGQVDYSIALTIGGSVQEQSRLLLIHEPYDGAQIVGAISMYDLAIRTIAPCPDLLAHLQGQAQVIGARQGSDALTIRVDRIVFHSPAP